MSKIITDAAKLDAAIVAVNKAANKLNDAIQLTLASAVFQAVYGRNTNHLNALALAVGKGVRRSAIGAWILKHAPVVAESDKEKAKDHPFRFSKDRMAELADAHEWADAMRVTAEEAEMYGEAIMAEHWTEFKPDQLVPESFDVYAAIKSLMSRAQQLQGKGTQIKGADALRKLGELLPKPATDVQGV